MLEQVEPPDSAGQRGAKACDLNRTGVTSNESSRALQNLPRAWLYQAISRPRLLPKALQPPAFGNADQELTLGTGNKQLLFERPGRGSGERNHVAEDRDIPGTIL